MTEARRWPFGRGYEQTSESLAFYRIVYAAWTLFILGAAPFGVGDLSSQVGRLPDGFYHPPLGPAMLFGGWPSETFLVVVQVVRTLALGMLLLGAWTRTSSLVIATSGLILSGFLFADGKIDHSILWVVILPAVMACTSWGDRWSVDASRERVRGRAGFRASAVRPIQIMAYCTGITFAAAGLVKAATGWLNPESSSVLAWTFAQQTQVSAPIGTPRLLGLLPSFAWPIADIMTVVFEVGFAIAAMRRDWFLPYLLIGATFHLSAGVAGFPWFVDIGVLYLLFVRWDGAAARLRQPLDRLSRLIEVSPWRAIASLSVVLALYGWVRLATGLPTTMYEMLDRIGIPPLVYWVLAIVAGGFVVLRGTRAVVDRRGNALPTWALGAAGVVLASQLAITYFVSEPWPSLAGPLFAGDFQHGDEIVVFDQHYYVANGEESIEIDRSELLGVPAGVAVNMGSVRFPRPHVGQGNNVVASVSRSAALAAMYHQFSSRHLTDYGGALDPEEVTYLRGTIDDAGLDCATDCVVRVEWERLTMDASSGHLISRAVVDSTDYPLPE